MDDKQYRALMDIINTSKKAVEGKLTENLEKPWWEVTEVQEWTSQELASKFNKSPYQFHRKENEVQFHFNATLLDSLSSTKKELEQLAPSSNGQKNTLKRVVNHLNEGRKGIIKRQKHIKVTELIRLWLSYLPGIQYDNNNLASDENASRRTRWQRDGLLRSAEALLVTTSAKPAIEVIIQLVPLAEKTRLVVWCSLVDHQLFQHHKDQEWFNLHIDVQHGDTSQPISLKPQYPLSQPQWWVCVIHWLILIMYVCQVGKLLH